MMRFCLKLLSYDEKGVATVIYLLTTFFVFWILKYTVNSYIGALIVIVTLKLFGTIRFSMLIIIYRDVINICSITATYVFQISTLGKDESKLEGHEEVIQTLNTSLRRSKILQAKKEKGSTRKNSC